jgi:hypothetical protein
MFYITFIIIGGGVCSVGGGNGEFEIFYPT